MTSFPSRSRDGGPGPWAAIGAVALSVLLLRTLGALLVSSRWRYAGLIVAETLCVGAPAALLAVAGRCEPVRLFRLRPAPPRLIAAAIFMATGGFIVAESIGARMVRALGPGLAPDLDRYIPGGAGDVAAALAALVLVPAVFEELLFRGYVLRGIESVPGAGLTGICVIVGLLFAAGHLSPALFPSQALLGAAITFVVLRSDSILPGIAFHATSNGMALALWPTGLLDRVPDSPAANALAAAMFVCAGWDIYRGTREP